MTTQQQVLRGILHVHSTFSYDGTLSISQLVTHCRARGYAFMCLTEHFESVRDNEVMNDYLAECHRWSDESFAVIPGVEHDRGKWHVLAMGVSDGLPGDDLDTFVDAARSQGAVLVLAHPTRGSSSPTLPVETWCQWLVGAEAWNLKYDSRYVPATTIIQQIGAIEAKGSSRPLLCFGGSDLHTLYNLSKLWVEVQVPRPSREAILGALKAGDFSTTNGYLRMYSNGTVVPRPSVHLLLLRALHRSMKGVGRTLKSKGIPLPETVLKIGHKVY